jgi:hypothetical protein
MIAEKREGDLARSLVAGFMLGVSSSFLVLLLATMVVQLLEATQSIFGLRMLFQYVFVPLVVQSCLVSIYVRGRFRSIILPMASTVAGTSLFLLVMFIPSLPITIAVPTMYNAAIASLLGGVVGTVFRETSERGGKMEAPAKIEPRKCWACGSEISPGAFFCQRCGEKVR